MKKRRQIKFLERKEVEKIIDAVDASDLRGARDKALIEVLFSTGMRIHEALALTKDEMIILAGEPATSEFPIIGKGGWQRVIFFSPRAKKAIRQYLAMIEEAEAKDLIPEDLLFPITIRCAQIMVGKRAKEAGIDKKVTPHIFRHSLATDLLRKGVDIRFVSEFLGHRSINNTMIYTHVVSPQLQAIHKKLYN